MIMIRMQKNAKKQNKTEECPQLTHSHNQLSTSPSSTSTPKEGEK